MYEMRRLAAFAVVIASGGCAATHPGDGSDRPDVVLYEQMFDALCTRARLCARGAWFAGGDATAGCDPARRAQTATAMVRGDAHLDTSRAQACIAGIATLGACVVHTPDFDTLWHAQAQWPIDALSETCDDAIVLDRQPCGDTTCALSDLCAIDAPCHGSCQHRLMVGEPCIGGQTCGPNEAFCQAVAGMPGTCVERCSIELCVRQGLGHACQENVCFDRGVLGGPCAAIDPACEGDLYCDAIDDVCRRQLGVDMPCDDAHGLQCAFQLECGAGSVCTSITATLPCRGDEQCPFGQYCHADGTCSTSVGGMHCKTRAWWPASAVIALLDFCPEGYSCTGNGFGDSTCQPTVAMGAACTATSACVDGTVCLGGVCAPPVDDSMRACSSPGDCDFGWTCVDGRCAPAHAACP